MRLLKSFILKETVLAVFLVLAGYFLFSGPCKDHYRNIVPILLLFIYLITAVVHGFLLHTGLKDSQRFVRRFMIASGLKLFLYLLIMVIYLLLNPEDAIIFLLSFLTFYLFFTVFEVISILRVLKKNIKD